MLCIKLRLNGITEIYRNAVFNNMKDDNYLLAVILKI